MVKKKSLEEQAKAFKAETDKLVKAGYVPIVKEFEIPDDSYMAQAQKLENGMSSITPNKESKCGAIGGLASMDANMLVFSQKVGLPIVDDKGNELGKYIPWGQFNNLPALIYRYAGDMPWTAQGLQYLQDTATGLGPRLMYHLARYSGGTVTDELIPYEDAGLWMRQRKRELLAAMDIQNTQTTYGQQLLESYSQELEELEQEYKEWESSLEEIEQFHLKNNLDQHYQTCMAEDVHLDIYFPTVGLSRGSSGRWIPKIVSIDLIDAVCTRFQERDENWNINNVFYSEQWRENIFPTEHAIVNIKSEDTVPYPVTMPEHGFDTIREYVKNSQRIKVGERKLWWVCPQYNAMPNKDYYPQSAWWSIFPSQVYRYAATLIYDKAVAKKNSVMWGKILYVNTSFLNKVFQQMGIEGDAEEQKKYRAQLYDRVEEFLQRRSNNGKLLIMDSYTSADEKQLIDSVRIVDVPQASEKDSDASLQIATSAVFFALGVHPALVGATPGSTASSGTFQRELHLLKVTQLSPRQRRYLAFLNNIVKFNGWPRHATYVIKQATLSTLDASKTGIVETHEE